MYICIYAHMCVCMYTYFYVCVNTHMQTPVLGFNFVAQRRQNVLAYMYVYICIYG